MAVASGVQCQTRMASFNSEFAPQLPPPGGRLYLSILTAPIGEVGGLVGIGDFVVGVKINLVSTMAIGAIWTATTATLSQPADAGALCGNILNGIEDSYFDTTSQLCKTSNATWDKAYAPEVSAASVWWVWCATAR